MKFLLSLIIVVLVAVPVVMPHFVQASQAGAGTGVQIPNPIKCGDVNCLVTQVIRYILGTIALIATGMFIWGGIMMMTSAGNAERVKKAKDTLAWAAVGIVVIILSWAIIQFVLRGLLNPSSLTTTTPTQTIGCCVPLDASDPGTPACISTPTSPCNAGYGFDPRSCTAVPSC